MGFSISCSAFAAGDLIPRRHSCDGLDVSPPIRLEDVPGESRSIALICDDPDAPAGTWVHWVLFNWPVLEKDIPEGLPPKKDLPNGARQGSNDFRRIGYGGPCPPPGTHRYYFRVYALDAVLSLPAGATKSQLLQDMSGHVLAEASLMGRYRRA